MTCELCDRLKLEAQGHAMEARGANDTIAKIYQIVTGARGEPGNWNAEVPVRDYIDHLRAAGEELANAAGDIHPTAPSSASIERLHLAIDGWSTVLARRAAEHG